VTTACRPKSAVPTTHEGGARATPDASPPKGDRMSNAPCPAHAECRILPLGDSITYGVASSSGAGYRLELFRRARREGQHLTFVGSSVSGPPMVDGVPFPQNNEGHSGFTIEDGGGRAGIGPLVVGAMKAHRPHVVTLMIGTNDVAMNLDLARAPARLAALVDRILGVDPKVLLLVATIVPTTDDAMNTRVAAYNAAIPDIVATRAGAGKPVRLVDMYEPFVRFPDYKRALFADSLHPNDAGFVVMADVWAAALAPR